MEGGSREGICWECRGINLDYFLDRPQRPNPLLGTPKHRVKWSLIRNDCALCLRLKSFFEPLVSATQDSDIHAIRLECFRGLEFWDTDITRCKALVLRLSSSAHVLREVFFVPSTFARKMDTNAADLPMVKRWIDQCQTQHHESCGLKQQQHLSSLRVINCYGRQLCKLPHGAPYICLSYVWGTESDSSQSSAHLPQQFPKTIEDSIIVALRIGIPYLWVDRYCVDQANVAEKHYLIQNMDVIYRAAALTIIMACGNGPHHGLPGINGTLRPPQQTFVVGQSAMEWTASLNPQAEISNSLWNTRAWTFQELLLSCRRLVFTDTQMYFHCAGMYCVETLYTSSTMDPLSDRIVSPEADDLSVQIKAFNNLNLSDEVAALYHLLQEYYQRRLSFAQDTISAFIGIVNAFGGHFSTLKTESDTECIRAMHFYGLPLFFNSVSPTKTFANSLAWWIHHGNEMWDTHARTTDLFPTWTWASIKASRHPHKAGTLNFSLSSWKVIHQDDIQIWILSSSGERVDMESYASIREVRHDDQDFEKTIFIHSWAMPCHLDAPSSMHSKSHEGHRELLGFAPGVLHLDFPMQQIGVDLVAIHLGTLDGLHANYARAVFLVVQESGSSVFRRVGLYVSDIVPVGSAGGLRGLFDAIRPEGAWEFKMLTII
jgi:hypothetical protein